MFFLNIIHIEEQQWDRDAPLSLQDTARQKAQRQNKPQFQSLPSPTELQNPYEEIIQPHFLQSLPIQFLKQHRSD